VLTHKSNVIYYNFAIIRYCNITFNANFLKKLFNLQTTGMINIKIKVFLLSLLAYSSIASAQETITINDFINWKFVSVGSPDASKTIITFDNATVKNVASNTPAFTHIITHGYAATIKTAFDVVQYADAEPADVEALKGMEIPSELNAEVFYFTQNRKPAAKVMFVPLVKDKFTGAIKKVIFFSLKINITPSLEAKTQASYTWADNSVLEKGDWIKMEVAQQGVYKVDVSFLNKAGLNVSGVDVSKLRLYGLGGGMLPQASQAPKNDDLVENAIEVIDINQNGLFDGNDYILFYAEGASRWEFEGSSFTYKHRANRYATSNFYYITVGNAGGKRLATQASTSGTPNYTTSVFDGLYYYEKDEVNFLKSGRDWYGEEFDRTLSYDFKISVPDRVDSEPIKIRSQAVGRSAEPCSFTTQCNGQTVLTQNIDGIYFSYEADYIDTPDTAVGQFIVSGNDLNIRYTFNRSAPGYKGWLNFFEIVARRKMRFAGNAQVIFRDSKNLGGGNLTKFDFDANGQNVTIWEVTEPFDIKKQQTQQVGNSLQYNLPTNYLREFVAFSEATLLVPDVQLVQKVKNQNLHGLRNVDMVIISHENFLTEAERLAEHHKTTDGLNTVVVTPTQIYNEFSSGKQDVSAIRNFMKMLYDRPAQAGDSIKYLLMFGDASYDYKNINKNNTNYVATYQSRNTYGPVSSYCSDDFFGQLDDDEGEWDENGSLSETIDIGIGRIPVQSEAQAKQMVDKIIAYTNPKSFGDWRNNVCFIADDEDQNIHLDDGQIFSAIVESQDKVYNVDKIYLDAYKQVSVGSGARYPEVNEQINRKMQKGVLIINYNGHGGELGLANEQILDVPMINAWSNINNMPLFVTATCEFSRFDDPARASAGELALLNPNGGAIALLTTVRLVYQWPNRQLNRALYDNNVFEPVNGEMPRLGDVFRKTKNGAPSLNSRNFTLLGDPAVRLNYPKHTIVTTEINGVAISGTNPSDTLGALSKVTIKGQVEDENGNKLSSFNGIVYPTVFDKRSNLSTLGNDPTSIKKSFSLYKNIIYKGKANVKDGEFEFSFIVPQDISYVKGNGKISYYATNSNTDAHGYYDSLIVTGTDKKAPSDITGPTIRLFMNDTTFRFGGVTDESPSLVALVSDLHGINTTGSGIGRDLTAILDDNRGNVMILNDYYQAKLDSYQEGEIIYPLSKLSEGKHSLKVKVWDVYNNSAEAYTEFVVANSAKLALKNLINYPNPFSDKTKFYFEHNRQDKELYVDIEIFTLDGKRLKTLSAFVPSASANFDGLEWDSREYGNNIGQGVYLFRVKVRSGNETVEETEKMVLIK